MILIVIFVLFSSTGIFAGEVYEQFKETQKEIDALHSVEKKEQENLHTSLLSAFKSKLVSYYKYKDAHKMTMQEIQFEKSEDNDFTYYIKYKDFVGYFKFPNNPKENLSIPIQEKILLKPGVTFEKFRSLLKESKSKPSSSKSKPVNVSGKDK